MNKSVKGGTKYSTSCVYKDLTLFAFLRSVQFPLFSMQLQSLTTAEHRKEVFTELIRHV